ncbi:MAG TPA: histidinol dehydrogenase, partial [Dehalococcoidia bacterium]|nr:histidinol dehydrogenase [Dehalococcoidia bacterium]
MKILTADEARRSILKRQPASETELGESGRARTAAVFGSELSAAEAVRRIIADVRAEGDAAVRRYGEAFDGVSVEQLEVPRAEVEASLARIDLELREALEFAAGRIRTYHEGQLRRCLSSYVEDGLGVQVRAIETVGFYAPGTTPAYPSSVLHTIVPARVAG